MKLKYKVLDERAKVPRRAHPSDAGLDLAPVITTTIHPGATVKLGTGIAIEVAWTDADLQGARPVVGLMCSRSSARAKGLAIHGIVDESYRGELFLIVTNAGVYAQRVTSGEYIAQLIIVPVFTPELERVEELSATERGEKGFGSTDQ